MPASNPTIYRDDKSSFYVEIDGEYGDETSGVYLYDIHGEIVSWVNEEWENEPSLVAKILHAVASGFTEGPDQLRQWMNRPKE